jgi:starch synthase
MAKTAERGLRILFVSAEVSPYAKAGGLGDVAAALPKALRLLGHDVRVFMPRYGRISPERYALSRAAEVFQVALPDRAEPAGLSLTTLDGILPVYMIENDRYFNRESIYGYADDGERFLFFCRAALEAARQLRWQPDIVHCNDWHTAIIPNILKTSFETDPFYAKAASVFTIHNLAYQGIFDQKILAITGLGSAFIQPNSIRRSDDIDLMSQGILYADVVNTVSPTYAQEILTAEYGEGLEPVLKYRKNRLFGILNGLDTQEFDPATDTRLTARYDQSSLEKKEQNKLAMQAEGRLEQNVNIPVIGIVSRLADQKGFDLLKPIVEPLLQEAGAQIVLLGTGETHYQDFFRRIGEQYPGKAAIALTFDADLAQRIYAGSDMFLMPSRYEPCGLGQMIAMRYGTVPVVRRTGGLADTVADFDPATGEGDGFVFERYTSNACFIAVLRAIEAFRRPTEWRRLQLRGMQKDQSWQVSAEKYVELYRKAQELKVTG